jgi:hypothetical protein
MLWQNEHLFFYRPLAQWIANFIFYFGCFVLKINDLNVHSSENQPGYRCLEKTIDQPGCNDGQGNIKCAENQHHDG